MVGDGAFILCVCRTSDVAYYELWLCCSFDKYSTTIVDILGSNHLRQTYEPKYYLNPSGEDNGKVHLLEKSNTKPYQCGNHALTQISMYNGRYHDML